MKKYSISIKSLAAVGLLLATSCTYDFPEPDPNTVATAGEADFSKFVTIGNSLTAGVADGALYDRSQQNSFPAILARQFALVGGGDFVQPDVNAPAGCYNPAGGCSEGRLRLVIVNGSTTIRPITPGNIEALAPFADKANLSNFGVPGMSIGLAQTPFLGGPSTGNPYFNPYYARIASNPGTSTALEDFVAELKDGGTFFSFWLGNIDVLGYATNGADQNDPTRPLTELSTFSALYNNALTTILTENTTAKGVLANIPNVTSVPYFSTVPYNPVVLTNQTQIDQINAGYAAYNGGLDLALAGNYPGLTAEEVAKRKVVFAAGQNPVVIVDESLTDLSALGLPSYREATATDLVVLPASSFIGTLVGNDPSKINGITVPLADKWILLPSEIAEINDRTNSFNSIIASIVDDNSERLALVDANQILNELKTAGASGITVNGIKLDATFTPPFGAFSVDGVHPNSRGYAYLANKFLEVVNNAFSARVPYINPNDYPGNDLPVPSN